MFQEKKLMTGTGRFWKQGAFSWIFCLLLCLCVYVGLAVDESQSRSVNQSLHDNGETCTPGGETQCGDNKHCEMIGNKAFCKCNPGYHLEKSVCEGKVWASFRDYSGFSLAEIPWLRDPRELFFSLSICYRDWEWTKNHWKTSEPPQEEERGRERDERGGGGRGISE